MTKRIACAALALLLLSTVLSACSRNDTGKDFIYPIAGDIDTLDPQSASTSDELMIIENTMEGLLRFDADGALSGGIAERWEVSGDGLTYTFYLRDNAKWDLNSNILELMEDETWDPYITAHDFVFALQRAAMPNTQAPYFIRIASIDGAWAVHEGSADASALGVRATDDFTLEIKLSETDEHFLETMAMAIAMPCNEEFFYATKGRYGLEKDLTLFNGPFYLSRWYDTSLLIRLSETYTGSHTPLPSDVTFTFNTDQEAILEHLQSGLYDAAIIGGSDAENLPEDSGISLSEYRNKSWCYIFNCTDDIMENENIRRAILQSLEEPEITDYAYITAGTGILPRSTYVETTLYRDQGSTAQIEKNAVQAEENWLAGLKELNAVTVPIQILCPTELEDYVREAVQGLQKTLGMKLTYVTESNTSATIDLSIQVTALEEAELVSRVKAGEYQIALYPFTAENSSAEEFVSKHLGSGNVMGFADEAYLDKINSLDTLHSEREVLSVIQECEQTLVSSAVVSPLFFASNYFATAKGVSGVTFYEDRGTVDFVFARRAD